MSIEMFYQLGKWSEQNLKDLILLMPDYSKSELIAESSLWLLTDKPNFKFRVDFLSKDSKIEWSRQGVHFIDKEVFSINDFSELSHLSYNLISNFPSLLLTINYFVKNLIPLKADKNLDVSLSDPNLPFTVFVSLPSNQEKDGYLRFAEGLIHEALHLQLTAIEKVHPLVYENRLANNIYSPWKGEGRDVRGLLHAAYVFSSLYFFWESIYLKNKIEGKFAFNRCIEIKQQMKQASHLSESKALTPLGLNFSKGLFSLFNAEN